MSTPTASRAEQLQSGPRSSRWKWLQTCLSHRSMALGATIVLLLVLIALFGPIIVPHAPGVRDTSRMLVSPDSHNLFGTDHYGRDVLSRVVAGARISMIVGLSVMLVGGIAGTIVGLVAGYVPWTDNLLMRVIDVLMAFPSFLLALGIVALLGQRLSNVIIALAVTSIPGVARVVRGVTLQTKEMQYVEAARATGSNDLRVLSRHIFPNCIAALTVQLTIVFASAVLAEASLSFIGAGVPPDVPSWGIILSEGRNYLQTGPWIALFGGIAISITVLSINLFGDGLRDVTDPRLRHR